LLAKQEFAGYWEYVLDEALFTGPAHPLWGGSALIGNGGELLGIGSLQLQRASRGGRVEDINMYVPIDLLKPIQEELTTSGRTSRPPRPWLGLYATEVENRVVVAGLASQGPAKLARLKTGDILLSLAGEDIHDLADLWRRLWSLGQAGVEVPLLIYRDGRALEVKVTSADREKFLKRPRLQ
jgi:S1-C subfamily serine protease